MDSFLASRPTITKLGAPAKPGSPAALETIITQAHAPAGTVPTAAATDVMIPAPPAASPSHGAHGARVEVVRDNDRVTGIVVVCQCGERIELDCVY